MANPVAFELSKETIGVLHTAGVGGQRGCSVISFIVESYCCGSNDSPPTCCY